MIPYNIALQAGGLPMADQPVRFAVGAPGGLTSNSWRIWSKNSGIYIACRDNFREAKVSLHTRGRWRMGFTEEALPKIAHLRSAEENRAWDVWDEPPASLPGTVIAFRLVFPTSELAVRLDQRVGKLWKDTLFIEAGTPGKITVITLFVTDEDRDIRHESEPSFPLGRFNLPDGRFAVAVAHGDPESAYQAMMQTNIRAARERISSLNFQTPEDAYAYFLGRHNDGSRFLFGARMGPNREMAVE